MESFGSYNRFVVVAEDEMEIVLENRNAPVKVITRLVNYKWQCSIKTDGIRLQCLEVMDKINGVDSEVEDIMHIEAIAHFRYWDWQRKTDSWQQKTDCKRKRFLYYPSSDVLKFKIKHHSDSRQRILLTIRVLKQRSEFPLFTAPNSVGEFVSNAKLRVGQQIYHVNKQLLSCFSPYFDKLFNDGNYIESKQEEITLEVDTFANPDKFEDFLLALTSHNQIGVLPNSQNVADFLAMADFFDVDFLKTKCERQLELCREMDIMERFSLAKKFGFKELQTKLVEECTPEENKRVCLALLDDPKQ